MYTRDEYSRLKQKYGTRASWAIWSKKDQDDPLIIEEFVPKLHSKYILLGLNASGPIESIPWINFHKGPSNVRKLKYASTNNGLWGSYITDLFKDIPEKNSLKLREILTDELINKNVNSFYDEMKDIKIGPDSVFIVFGYPAEYYFNKYFRSEYKNPVIPHYHYSYYGISDLDWVTRLWKKLNILQDFNLSRKEYKDK